MNDVNRMGCTTNVIAIIRGEHIYILKIDDQKKKQKKKKQNTK